MYELRVKSHFDAAHYLRGYNGPCANLHGHTWNYEVVIKGEQLNRLGMLIDFKEIKEVVKVDIHSKFDHAEINKKVPFTVVNPTAENLAEYIYNVVNQYPGLDVVEVTVWESPECGATYRERVSVMLMNKSNPSIIQP